MPNIFILSDLHLGHANVLKFTIADGSLLRPGFANIDEHDDFIIDSINSVVNPNDRLILVGDCVMNKLHMYKLDRINGKKTLVMGNHDPTDPQYLTPYFEKLAGALPLSEFILTHIPVHELQVQHRFKGNIHGHLHDGDVKLKWGVNDPRYFNVCCEKFNYKPIAFEDLKKQFYARDFSRC